jgi:peptidoglycan hydrolase-like protein with peptidoglycan-binding domain
VPESEEQTGERTERVKAMQRQLSWLGFDPGPADGRYGPETTEAVRRFQAVRGLPTDGVADPATLRSLQSGTVERPFTGRAERVKELQLELTMQGFDPGPIDGSYGPVTTEAVKGFQQARDLPVDGIAEQSTLDALRGRTRQDLPEPRVERVKDLQSKLSSLGHEPGPVDGRYGPVTTEAVKRFQRAHDLPVDGVADPVTLRALHAGVRGRPFTGRTERVKELQRQLSWLGFEPGMIDGRYGQATTEAVERFQREQGLTVDGVADPVTLNAIRARVAEPEQGTPDHELTQQQQR